MQQKSYQDNVEFYKMMQRVREEAKKESSKIKQAKENDKKAKDALNEEQRKFMEQLRKYNK